ncbi:MAG TPA: energy transducer TonB [Blastocatellia bacterium]|nr:energy transducer TonB [Blastocatellia bacterium]
MARPLAIAVLLSFLIAPAAPAASSLAQLRLHEISLRKRATRQVLPQYPEVSKKSGAKGVTVSMLDIDEEGNVAGVDVLEAPDSPIRAAVADAVKLWKFKPATVNGKPVRLRGKLTFYYVIEGGNARVENPKQ